jgi:hypothetical protein
VLIDRGIGLLGLVLMAALGATASAHFGGSGPGVGAGMLNDPAKASGRMRAPVRSSSCAA